MFISHPSHSSCFSPCVCFTLKIFFLEEKGAQIRKWAHWFASVLTFLLNMEKEKKGEEEIDDR